MAGGSSVGGSGACHTQVLSTTERTLLMLRHSKSAYPEGAADIDRPLSPRGQRDAVSAGTWIGGQGLIPDLVVCSAAARTRQTWDLVSDRLAWADDGEVVRYDARLYNADTATLVTVVQETPPEVEILALVGHNPAASDLVATLTGKTGLNFPTSALAVIGFRRDWDRVAPGSGSLDGYWTPKGGSAVPGG
jgi:phosphohistidine phosphatase